MENRKLVGNVISFSNSIVTIALTSIFTGALAPTPVLADKHGKVRMYKLNNNNQQIQQRWIKDDHVAGCHNTAKSRQVHRFAQLGFNFCQIFSETDCPADSEVSAMWGEKKYRQADIDVSKPQLNLIRGTQWMLKPESNVKIQSWFCHYK